VFITSKQGGRYLEPLRNKGSPLIPSKKFGGTDWNGGGRFYFNPLGGQGLLLPEGKVLWEFGVSQTPKGNPFKGELVLRKLFKTKV